jgi:hypothetical protein
MIFENLITENKAEFLKKVNDIAEYLGVKSDWLMFCFYFETAHTMSSHIQNSIKATGLIQIIPSTAKELGTTVEALKSMSNVAQLDFVKKYLAKYRGKYHSFVDLYLAIFYPATIGKPDNYTITSDLIAKQNPVFDLNRDKDITKGEIKQALLNQIPKEFKPLFIC